MTRSIEKTNCVDHIDRISDLPGNVIDRILKRLSIPELVRTGILSKKWRYMWMSVPELVFCNKFYNRFKDLNNRHPEISRIITEILFLHNGPLIRFSLEYPYLFHYRTTTEYLSKWILFLSRRGIKDLQLHRSSALNVKMPSHIFSCQELTRFRCSGFHFSVPPNFSGLKKLLDLDLMNNTYEFGALQNLISGCPLLEKLSIRFYGDLKSICLKNAKNLIDLRIMICHERASGLIKSLPKIQRLTIRSSYGSKMLCADIIPPTQLISLKYLKLRDVNLNEREEVLYFINVLKSASGLVDLHIRDSYQDGELQTDQPEEFECNSCCLSQLQTVNITVRTNFKYTMSLIRFILENSSSLQTLNFRVGSCLEKTDPAVLLSISRNLLRMERASQRARVEFLHP